MLSLLCLKWVAFTVHNNSKMECLFNNNFESNFENSQLISCSLTYLQQFSFNLSIFLAFISWIFRCNFCPCSYTHHSLSFGNLCVSCLSYNSVSIHLLKKRDLGENLPGVIYFLHTRCSFQPLWLSQSFTCLLRWARVGPISANWADAF